MPILRLFFTYLAVVAVLIDDFAVNDIENLLGVYVSTMGALGLIVTGLAVALFKNTDDVHRIAILNHVASLVHHNNLIKDFVNIAAGLVNDHKNEFAFER